MYKIRASNAKMQADFPILLENKTGIERKMY